MTNRRDIRPWGCIDYRLLRFLLFRLYRGLVCLRKTRVVCGLVYMQLHIRVGVGGTRVKILGSKGVGLAAGGSSKSLFR